MSKQTSKQSEAYEAAVKRFHVAVDQLQKGDYRAAGDQFDALIQSVKDEPVLIERSKMYRLICKNRLEPVTEPGSAPDDLYYRAVVSSNDGNPAEAVRLLDQALQQKPNEVRLLFARASAWALSGNSESAVRDLQQAIAIDPTVRFQAVNDPDFEGIREEPGFIDIIEPTPTGA